MAKTVRSRGGAMGAFSPERQQKIALAMQLVARKLRTTPAHALTGVPEPDLRRLYRQMHGSSPSSGSIPSTAHLLTSRRLQAKASAFLAIYHGLEGREGPLEASVLVMAYDQYVAFLGGASPEMDMTAAWSLVREYQAGISHLERCRRCTARYLVAQNADIPLNCPFCALRSKRPRKSVPT